VKHDRIGVSLDPQPNDLHLDQFGHLAVVTDAHAVGQHARQRLQTFSGEWFLDTTCGVPWLSDILGRTYDPALAESVVKAELLNTDQVTEITSFSVRFAHSTRGLSIREVAVSTVYGEVQI
jgi:hypothetical protein